MLNSHKNYTTPQRFGYNFYHTFVGKLLGCTVDCNSKVLVPNVKYYYTVRCKSTLVIIIFTGNAR